MRCLAGVRDDARKFNSKVLGNIINKRRKLEARIQCIHHTLETVDYLSLSLLEKDLQVEYSLALKQEELLSF